VLQSDTSLANDYARKTRITEMKPTLILMRHAQAVDRMEAEDDFQRGLTQRGRDDTAAAAEALTKLGATADMALVSPSWRTNETYRGLIPALGSPTLNDPMVLYHASTSMLERATLEALEQSNNILLVGHNPGIGGFAHNLAAKAGQLNKLPHGYPTATVSVFTLDSPDLTSPRLQACYRPNH
jgi:phosphohistidine phosphatase